VSSVPALYLSKVATQLVHPLVLALLVAALGLALVWRGRPRAGSALAAAALGALWLASTPAVAFRLLHGLESRHPPVAAEQAPVASAIVVLGGGVRQRDAARPWADLNSAGDRLLHAARLYRAGKAPWLILSGGEIPWVASEQSQAQAMADLLVEWGVPRDAILLEEQSRTTWENAARVKQIVDERGLADVLLVTSAAHMPRSLETFEVFGVRAIPAPTDFEAEPAPAYLPLSWLADAPALRDTTRALKEYLGIEVYRLRAARR
jgi:uncharacterized SAM-binding protein YcdF (DUF218 family)